MEQQQNRAVKAAAHSRTQFENGVATKWSKESIYEMGESMRWASL